MSNIHQGFIGISFTNRVVEYSGGDHETTFRANLKTQPDDWYYRTHKVTYSYNSLGHRCKNIEDVDLDNYILFAGCSHTEGVGIELEKTYPYRVAEILGCDYYNLAMGGAGIDVLTHNLIMWNKRVSKKPKALVILWPHHIRFATIEGDEVQLNLLSDGNYKTENFIMAGEEINFFDSSKRFSQILISNLYDDCPIFNIGWNDYPTDCSLSLNMIDLARDLAHAGIESNEKIAVELAARIR